MSSHDTDQPQCTLRDGSLKMTIWKNKGEKGVYFTATPAKTYKKEDELHDCNNYSVGELLRLSELSRQAYLRIRKLQQELAREMKALREAETSDAAPLTPEV